MIRILIPLDGSLAAEASLSHAIAIAKAFPAELTLLRVIAEPATGSVVRTDSVYFALWRQQAQSYLDGLVDRHAIQDLSIDCKVAEGRPAETILQFIGSSKPDLVILTRFGHGNAQNFATGGTAQKIVSSVDCSVLLLDPGRPTDPKQRYRRILVPIDDTRDADCAVAIATMIAEVHNASLLLLHVIDEPRLPSSLPASRRARDLVGEMHRLVRAEAEQRLRQLAAQIPSHISVERRVLVSTDTSLAIESTADDDDCSLLLLHAPGSEPEQSSRYDPVSQSLILYSHLPLFILRSPASEHLASNFRSVYLDQPSYRAS